MHQPVGSGVKPVRCTYQSVYGRYVVLHSVLVRGGLFAGYCNRVAHSGVVARHRRGTVGNADDARSAVCWISAGG